MSKVRWKDPEELDATEACLVCHPEGNVDRLPLVYLLHGQKDTEADWFGEKGQLRSILSKVAAGPMILVMPFCAAEKLADPRVQRDPSLADFGKRFEAIEKGVRKRFGAADRLRGILGISMGGRQALYLVLTGKLAGISALGVLSGQLQDTYPDELSEEAGGLKGKLPSSVSLYYHYCGGPGGSDNHYRPGNERVCAELGGKLEDGEAAAHSWSSWRPQLRVFFRKFGELAAEQADA